MLNVLARIKYDNMLQVSINMYVEIWVSTCINNINNTYFTEKWKYKIVKYVIE